MRQVLVIIFDLEKDRRTVDLERARIMLFVWVIGMAKIVKGRDGLDDALDSFFAKGSNAWRDDGMASGQALT